MKIKLCNNCNQEKELNSDNFVFRKDKVCWENPCKECRRIKGRNYHLNHLEEAKIRHKKWVSKNKERVAKQKQLWVQKNCKAVQESKKKWYEENHDRMCQLNAQNHIKNKEERNLKARKYYKENIHKFREYKNKNRQRINAWRCKKEKENRDTNPAYKMRIYVSNSIHRCLKKNSGSKGGISCLTKIDYSINELKKHLESQFESWMNWDNYGVYKTDGKKTWQIDHIIPQSKLLYNSMDHPNFKKCWALSNIRPLESYSNLIKSNN